MSRRGHTRSWATPVAGSLVALLLGVAAEEAVQGVPRWSWTPFLAGVVVLAIVLAQLFVAWRASRTGRPSGAVLRALAPGGRTVGHAVRLRGRRWVVCPVDVVHRALGGARGEAPIRPDRTETVRLQTADRRHTVDAAVVVWGPSLPHSDLSRLALLRTRQPLPWRGGGTLHPVPPADGPVEIVIPDPSAPSRPTSVPGTLHDGSVSIPMEGLGTALADRVGGAAVIAHGRSADGTCLGVLDVPHPPQPSPQPSPLEPVPSGETPPGTPDVQVRVLDAQEATTWVRREVTRRQAVLGVTWAALAGVGAGTAWYVGHRPLRGAGWTELFVDPVSGHARDWLAGAVDIDHVRPVSGRESLQLDRAALEDLDFITAPNALIAGQLRARIRTRTGRDPGQPITICFETMMVVARPEFLPAMIGHGLLLRYRGHETEGVYLDLTRYLKRCHLTWGQADPTLSVRPGNLVSIDIADPAQSGGGVNFLEALEYTRLKMRPEEAEEAKFTRTEHLWRTDPARPGPLARDKEPSSDRLIDAFKNRQRHVIYTYEHHALALAAQAPDDVVVLHTRPEATFTQHLLILSRRAEGLRDRLSSPVGQQALTRLGLRIPDGPPEVKNRVAALHRRTDAVVRARESASRVVTSERWQPVVVDLDNHAVAGLVQHYVDDHPAEN